MSDLLVGEEFVQAWRALVARWCAADDEAATALLQEVLEHGLSPADGTRETDQTDQVDEVDDEDVVRCEIALVRQSGEFDRRGYRALDVVPRDARPIGFFCRRGWKALLHNPHRDFDTWWYWWEHLDPTSEAINPFVHFLAVGRHHGLTPLPPQEPTSAGTTLGPAPRRACLYAAWDADGVVDETVVQYVADLARHADVFYLADCAMPQEELDKLAPHTRGAWAIRHGGYDFGSYSMLATDLVGWDALDAYDEVVLANDSCYLVRPLEDTFATMATRACDWWGLQATKRDFETARGDHEPIPLAEAQERMIGERTLQQLDHLHVSSYFLVLRRPALQEPRLRALLGAVVPQSHKWRVILQYEIGLSRVLTQQGHRFDTLMTDLYPFHPLYSDDYWTMLERGFPLLKRNLLSENPRQATDLARWRERITAVVPDAPVDAIARSLTRVAADDALHRALSVTRAPDGSAVVPHLLDEEEFAREDRATPTFDHWWAFPVCGFDHTFAGNERALFEEVRDDPSIKKIVLTRSRHVDVDGENVVVVPLRSPEGQHHLLRAGQVFVKHSLRINAHWPISPERHNVVNLWHGIPLKRFGWAAPASDEDRATIARENASNRAVITSSKIDTLAMNAAFHPLSIQHLWPTGLPRIDLVVREDERLPADLRAEVERLRSLVAGRRLVMFLPTFKVGQADAYYPFAEDELARLRAWMEQHDAVLGVREHMADQARTYSTMLAPLEPLDLSARRFPNLEPLYRVADALVTDYSSCLVDFLATGKPVISFAYDHEHYSTVERGLFYDLDEAVPGPVARTFDELETALHGVFAEPDEAWAEEYAWRRRRFFDHLDDRNAERVVQRVRALYVREA